jgi:serine/threonine-protein kinase
VFLALDGALLRPKLMDFGIARMVRGDPFGPGVTQSGSIVGTPSYISPEQAQAHPDIDHRSDEWSFCVTLYECLSLSVPFAGSSWSQLHRAILHDEPPSLVTAGTCDPALWGILCKGLAKNPDARFDDMAALARELAAWLVSRGEINDVCGTSLHARWLDDPASKSRLSNLDSRPTSLPPKDPTLRSVTRSIASVRPPPSGRRATFVVGGLIVTAAAALSVVSAMPGPRMASVAEVRPPGRQFAAAVLPWAQAATALRQRESTPQQRESAPPRLARKSKRATSAPTPGRSSSSVHAPPFDLIDPYASNPDAVGQRAETRPGATLR